MALATVGFSATHSTLLNRIRQAVPQRSTSARLHLPTIFVCKVFFVVGICFRVRICFR